KYTREAVQTHPRGRVPLRWTMRLRSCEHMFANAAQRPWVGLAVSASVAVLSAIGVAACGGGDSGTSDAVPTSDTASPIKHVIIVVGENRSFDHVFATYVPQHPEEGIPTLLSEQIV